MYSESDRKKIIAALASGDLAALNQASNSRMMILIPDNGRVHRITREPGESYWLNVVTGQWIDNIEKYNETSNDL